MPAVYNAANESAVSAFLSERIGFSSILRVLSKTVEKFESSSLSEIRDLSDVSALEQNTHQVAEEIIKKEENAA